MPKISTTLFIFLFFTAVNAFAIKMNLEDFAQHVEKVIQKSFPEWDCHLQDSSALICGNATIGIENLRRRTIEIKAEENAIDDIIIQHVGLAKAHSLQPGERVPVNNRNVTTAGTEAWPDAELLRPQLVPIEYSKHLGDNNVSEFLPGILIAWAIDYPDRYEFVLDNHIQQWSVTRDSVRDKALHNLEKISAQLNIQAQRPKDPSLPGKWLSIAVNDGYAAARILLPSVRKRIVELLGDNYFIAFPNRDFLIAWSNDFANHMEYMAQVEKDFKSRHHPLSPEIFIGNAQGVRKASASELTAVITSKPLSYKSDSAQAKCKKPKAQIADYGIYKAIEGGRVEAEDVTTGYNTTIYGKELVKKTTNIPAKLGINFGFRYALQCENMDAATVPVTIRVFHPKMRNPLTDKESTESFWTDNAWTDRTNIHSGWVFAEPWEIVQGKFHIQVLAGDDIIAEKEFTVE